MKSWDILLTTLLISSPAWSPWCPQLPMLVTHSSVLSDSASFPFASSPCCSSSWDHPEINHFTQILCQGCLRRRPAEGSLWGFLVLIWRHWHSVLRRESKACSALHPLLRLLCAPTAWHATPNHLVQCSQETGELCNAHFKGTLVYRVLYYLWLQTSGGLGTSPTDKEELLFLDHRCTCSLWPN